MDAEIQMEIAGEEIPEEEILETIPVTEEKKRCAWLHKAWSVLKGYWEKVSEIVPKKIQIIAAVSVAVVICGICVYCYSTNNYMTPIHRAEKLANKATYDVEKEGLRAMNGIGVKQWKRITKILEYSDYYQEALEESTELIEKIYDNNLDIYGEDYKVTLKKTDVTELTKFELRNYRRSLQSGLNNIEDLVDSAEEFLSEDWREAADELGLSKSDTKKLIEEYGKLAEDLGRLQVSEGYEVHLERKINGELIEESVDITNDKKRAEVPAATEARPAMPGETKKPTVPPADEKTADTKNNKGGENAVTEQITIVVLKVNGRWVEYNSFKSAYSPFDWF